jgi:hypothetical protein
MYHSILSSWPTGLRIEDASTLANATASPQLLKFEANSLDNHTVDYSHNGSWNPGMSNCALDMTDWMTNSGTCSQRFNEFSPGSLGYDGSICEDFCEDNTPSFLMSDDELGDTAYLRIPDLASDNFFVKSAFRGAFDESTDWTAGWTAFCPQQNSYCTEEKRTGSTTGIKGSGIANSSSMTLYPNPATHTVYATFNMEKAGHVHITIINSLGQTVRSIDQPAAPGEQRTAISTEGLSKGVYMIMIDGTTGKTQHARFIVK